MKGRMTVTYHLESGERLVEEETFEAPGIPTMIEQAKTKFQTILKEYGELDGVLFEHPHEIARVRAPGLHGMTLVPGHRVLKITMELAEVK